MPSRVVQLVALLYHKIICRTEPALHALQLFSRTGAVVDSLSVLRSIFLVTSPPNSSLPRLVGVTMSLLVTACQSQYFLLCVGLIDDIRRYVNKIMMYRTFAIRFLQPV